MNKELLDEADYLAITSNQTRTIEELNKTNQLLTSTNELSDRFIGEAIHNFRRGAQAIGRIRSNLDQIHKALTVINKARGTKTQ